MQGFHFAFESFARQTARAAVSLIAALALAGPGLTKAADPPGIEVAQAQQGQEETGRESTADKRRSTHIDEIVAFHTYALPQPRMTEIRRHLESCRHCLTRAGRARSAEQATAYRSPSPDLLQRVQRGFRRPKGLRRLGTLIVHGLSATLTPVRAKLAASISQKTESRCSRFRSRR